MSSNLAQGAGFSYLMASGTLAPVPEPGPFSLLMAGLAVIGMLSWQRQRRGA
jgi:hypothetical protein